MDPVADIFSPQAALAIQRLLPALAGSAESHPVVTYRDWQHVRDAIGTPRALDDELAAVDLSGGDRLPAASASLLVNAVTVYALAFDLFDTDEQTLRWWSTHIALSPSLPAHAPHDWLGAPGYADELIARIGRTRHGIY